MCLTKKFQNQYNFTLIQGFQLSSRFYENFDRALSYLKRLVIRYLVLKEGPSRQLFLDEVQPNLDFEVVMKFSDNSFIEHFNKVNCFAECHAFESRYLIDARNIKIDTKTGLIFDQRSTVVSESSSWPADRILLSSPYVPRACTSALEQTKSDYLILPSNGFYHWLIEDLAPFLFALRNSKGPTKVLYFRDAPRYVLDLVRELPIQSVEMPRGVQLSKIRFVTRGPDTGWPLKEDILELRNFFASSLQLVNSAKKIYISRLKSTRSPEFEKGLVEILEREGWKILHLEDLSVKEQIIEFSSASIVCGVHGAGLSGIVWMDSNTKVIELSPRGRHVPCFSRLSSRLGIQHELVIFEEPSNEIGALQIFKIIQSKSNY